MPSPQSSPHADRLDQLKLWLIAAMLDHGRAAAADPGFSHADWQALNRCAGQHRIRPLLYHRLRDKWQQWDVPPAIRESWEQAAQRSAIRALNRQSVVVEVARRLTEAGIACAMLKGSALARHYGSAALRPMRDIDVLVRQDRAHEAFALLRAGGFQRRAGSEGLAHVDYTAHKHLEPLWCPRRNVAIEVHTALVELPRGLAADDPLLDIDGLLAGRRLEPIGGHGVPVLGWAETMLHLIVHAVYDHQLNNGPLVLSDCEALARDENADWNRLWELADISGRSNGVRLVFAIINRFSQPLPPSAMGDDGTDPALVEHSALLMLQDTDRADAQGGWDRLFAQGNWRHRLALARQRIALRQQAARQTEHHHGRSGNAALAWRMLRALADPAQRRDVARSRAVFGWLRDDR
ncbi:MAG: nucleotidyltransferase family protein [Sphingomonadales bacterium]|nr:nucleotidyltransferase family protein [Sphingomonadales bacterium]